MTRKTLLLSSLFSSTILYSADVDKAIEAEIRDAVVVAMATVAQPTRRELNSNEIDAFFKKNAVTRIGIAKCITKAKEDPDGIEASLLKSFLLVRAKQSCCGGFFYSPIIKSVDCLLDGMTEDDFDTLTDGIYQFHTDQKILNYKGVLTLGAYNVDEGDLRSFVINRKTVLERGQLPDLKSRFKATLKSKAD